MKLLDNVEVLQSKAIEVLLGVIRNKDTKNEIYVQYSDRICRVLAEEGLARLSPGKQTIQTPCGEWTGFAPVDPTTLCVVSIIRSGDILSEAVRQIAPGL